jgi:3-oxoacyl-[acyl-carrier-protein] synthase II
MVGFMEVVVTGVGPVLPNCADRATLWSHLRDGASQLAFEPAPGGDGARWAVGRIRNFDPARWLDRLPRKHYERYQREQQLYLASLVSALADAGLDLGQVTRERLGLFDGTSRGAFDHWYERAQAERVAGPAGVYSERQLISGTTGQAANLGASMLGVRGPVYTFSNTCCAGAVAIGHALRELADGELDVALASGHDSALSAPIYHMYRAAGLISEEQKDARRAVRPWAGHSGNAFGEGAVTLVLETAEHARARGAVPLARLVAYRYGNNGAHPLSVDKEGGRAATLIAEALRRGERGPDDIGFVVGHGNGVAQSDRSEQLYMERIFGARAAAVPLLSVKPIYGHLLGGSSALNVAAAALLLHHKRPVSDDADDLATPAAGLSVSFGIGGHNSVILLERA